MKLKSQDQRTTNRPSFSYTHFSEVTPFENLYRPVPFRDKSQNRVSSAFSFLFGSTTSGKTVNERTAMQTTAVCACVRILAEAIARATAITDPFSLTSLARKRILTYDY